MRFRTDKAGIVHCPLGKVAFEVDALRENMMGVLQDLKRLKPSASKGIYFRKVTVSSTMGPGIQVDHQALDI